MAGKELERIRTNFVDKISETLIKQLLDDLSDNRVLNDAEVESVLQDNSNKRDKARQLIKTVKNKGDRASKLMIAHIENRDPYLFYELRLTHGEPEAGTKTKTWSEELITTSDSFWEDNQDNDDVYPAKEESIKSRVALLITNRNFKNPQFTRKGAEKDEENMQALLESVGYEVVKHNDLTGKEIDKAAREFGKHPKLKDADSVFVVIMSHGKLGYILGVNYSPEEPDEFPVENLYKYLGSQRCPALLNKPKIIIIQACRGASDGTARVSVPTNPKKIVHDGLSHQTPAGNIVSDDIVSVHQEKDFTAFLSSTPGTLSYRNEDKGSFMIQYIVEVFNTYCHKDDIDELFRKVKRRFEDFPLDSNKQMATKDRDTLTRRFYLFPGH